MRRSCLLFSAPWLAFLAGVCARVRLSWWDSAPQLRHTSQRLHLSKGRVLFFRCHMPAGTREFSPRCGRSASPRRKMSPAAHTRSGEREKRSAESRARAPRAARERRWRSVLAPAAVKRPCPPSRPSTARTSQNPKKARRLNCATAINTCRDAPPTNPSCLTRTHCLLACLLALPKREWSLEKKVHPKVGTRDDTRLRGAQMAVRCRHDACRQRRVRATRQRTSCRARRQRFSSASARRRRHRAALRRTSTRPWASSCSTSTAALTAARC
jgi:hypothetical protein